MQAETRYDLEVLLEKLQAKKEEACQKSQLAYLNGLGAKAKELSLLKDEYMMKILEVKQKLKALDLKSKQENTILLTPKMEALILKEYRQVQEAVGFNELKDIIGRFQGEIIKNSQESRKAWILGERGLAKEYSDTSKAYRILKYLAAPVAIKAQEKKRSEPPKAIGDSPKKSQGQGYSEQEVMDFLKGINESRINGILAEERGRGEEGCGEDRFWEDGGLSESGDEDKRDLQRLVSELKVDEKGNSKKSEVGKTEASKETPKETVAMPASSDVNLRGLSASQAEFILSERLEDLEGKNSKEMRVFVGNEAKSQELVAIVRNFAVFQGFPYNHDERNGRITIQIDN